MPAYWTGIPASGSGLCPSANHDKARQLQHDTCLMTSNLNVLDQYVLGLQGTASKLLELIVGHQDFPSRVMESTAPVPRVCRASIDKEVMGLWRPPLGPDEPAWNFAPSGPDYSRPSCLQTMNARLAVGSCSARCGTLFDLLDLFIVNILSPVVIPSVLPSGPF